ncbi:MAG TPA: efflux RND transporter permease subunit, partial [Firmicutes bacterium]|nr:efflux RND transporter permease subunit [Bacillota bacterium]
MVLIIVVLGVVSVLNTDVDFLPNMDLPYVVVATVYAGQPAEIVESDVTAVLEQALGNMSAVQSVTSMSYDNVSVISLQLSSGSDVDAVADEIQGRLSSAGLPDSPYLQESMVIKANPNMLPSMSISVSRKGESVPDNMEYFNALADRIRAVDGVQDVTVQGLIDNYIMVSLNDEKTADVLHTQVKEGITGDSALSKFYSSLAKHLSGALNELEQYTLSDLSELSIYLQNLAAFYDELNDFLATDSGIAAMTVRSEVITAATDKIDELLALGTYSAANTIIKSIYPETADYAAVHINRLMLSSSATTGNTYGEQVANAAKAANSAVALIADAMVNISPDVFEDIFDYIANDSAPTAAQTPEAIKTLTETRLASFGTDLAEGHPYRNAAEYVRAHTAEFAQAVVDYCANLSSVTPATADSVREGAAAALKNASMSALEEQLCATLGYGSLDELFTALTDEKNTAEIYKKLTQTLSGVIDSDLIGTLIQAQNVSLPAGSYTENGITYIVNVDGSISTLQDLIFMPATGINLLSLVTSSWGDAEG